MSNQEYVTRLQARLTTKLVAYLAKPACHARAARFKEEIEPLVETIRDHKQAELLDNSFGKTGDWA